MRSRRRFLQGVGGVCMGLPFLEIFMPKPAMAAPPPKRYAFMFAGFSIGSNPTGKIAPANPGPLAGNLTRGLATLAGVEDSVSFISGLEIPVGVTAPAAGRIASFHSTSHQVLSCGERWQGGRLAGPSSDWVAASQLAGATQQPVLVYRAQPRFYYGSGDGGTDGVISARLNSSSELEQVPPVTSPRVAFESLFSGFIPPDPAEAATAKRLLAMRKSVVDLVATDAGALLPRLGRADKQRMERHFDELRALEGRLNAVNLPDSPACQLLPGAGDDPALGDVLNLDGGGSYTDNFTNSTGYSNEELRAEIMTDLIHMAFTCDISRVASFMITHAQCFMNMYTPLNLPSDLHEITHGSVGSTSGVGQEALADCAAWHIRFFTRLVQKLRDTEDIDGSSILDNTAIAMAFEGGWGFDLESGSNSSPHSTENMVMLVGGHAGGLNSNPGHIQAKGTHPTAVLNTALSAVGVNQTLGEVSGTVDGLIG